MVITFGQVAPGIANTMPFKPGVASASSSAWRNEPALASSVLVTARLNSAPALWFSCGPRSMVPATTRGRPAMSCEAKPLEAALATF